MNEWITAILEALGLWLLLSVVACLVLGRVFRIVGMSVEEEER